METTEMGRVVTEATIENLGDLWGAQQGWIPDDQVRRITVSDALVDTGATFLCLPTSLIRQLGLTKSGTRNVNTALGKKQSNVYGTVRLTIQGRACPLDVSEVSDEAPVLIGQIPLEYLDFVVDPTKQQLIGNPRHGGEYILDMY